MNKKKIISLVKQTISEKFKTDIYNLLIYFKDIDNDGINEIVALFNDHNLVYLKYLYNEWIIYENNKVNLYPAYIYEIKGKRWGYINNLGKYIIKPQFSEAFDFHDNKAIVRLEDKYGVINSLGEYIIVPRYDEIKPYKENRAIAVLDNLYYVIDDSGKTLTKGYSFISSYHNGLALVQDDNLYGYLDLTGEVAIPIKYKEAHDFINGKALVKEEKYQLIDTSGKVLQEYDNLSLSDYSNNMLIIKTDGKCGYINETGNVVVEPIYHICNPFKENIAVVIKRGELSDNYGLINILGEVFLEPIYQVILPLGENRFAVGKAKIQEKPYLGNMFAIVTSSGEFLTDFIYDNVTPFQNHLASAVKKGWTYFIDLKGKIIHNLPKIKGEGKLTYLDKIIRVEMDYELYYIDDENRIINSPNYIIPINQGLDVVINKYKPNLNYLVYYPQIEKIPMMNEVNLKLKQLSNVKPVPTQIQYDYYGNFRIIFTKKDLLEFELDGYKYQFGAAHGFPYREYVHLNMNTGDFYKLSQLFKETCDYLDLLSAWVINEAQNDDSVFIDETFKLNEDPLFYVDDDNLYIFFKPYEISPYSEGFKQFIIPFEAIQECIDELGEFWLSFH